ncbi:MAG: hypothetical protein SOZ71_10810 [Clostridium sp.]|nr:hypothetical protein [Clostridium sp.]
MNETIEKVTEETTKEERVCKIINSSTEKMMMEDLGISEKALEVCPRILLLINRAIGAIKDGEKEQREKAIYFLESLELIGIVKPGTSLDIKDTCYTFNKYLFRNKKSNFFDNNSDSKPSIKEHIIEVPSEKGLSKKEFDNNIMQQIQKNNAGMDKDLQDAIVNKAWESYQRNVESEQEDNGNV